MKLKDFNNHKIININGQVVKKKSPWPKVFTMTAVTIIIVMLLIYSKPNIAGFSVFKEQAKSFFKFEAIDNFSENVTIGDTFFLTIKMLWKTILLSILGTVIGIVVSVPLAFLSSKNIIKKWYIYMPTRTIMSIIRAVPPLIIAFLLKNAISLSLTATLTLGIFVASLMTKWLYEELDSIDLNAFESLQALGNQKSRSIAKAVMPYLMKSLFSYGMYAFEIVIRFSAVLGIAGIKTVGYLLSVEYREHEVWGHMTTVLMVLITAIMFIELGTYAIKKYFIDRKPKQLNIPAGSEEYRIAFVKISSPKAWVFKLLGSIALVALILFSIMNVEWKFANETKMIVFKSGMHNIFRPEWGVFKEIKALNPVYLALEALMIAMSAVVIGFFFSFFIGMLASKAILGTYFSWIFKLLLIIIRSIPAFVYAIVFMFLSPVPNLIFAAVLALGIHSIGMLGKLTYEKIDSVDLDSRNALEVMGTTRLISTRWALLKAVMPTLISNAIYRIEINFKSTVEIGAILGIGFGWEIYVNSTPIYFSTLSSFIIITIAIILMLEQISNALRRKIMTGQFVDKNNIVLKKIRHSRTINALINAKAFNLSFKRNNETIKFNNYIGRKLKTSHDNRELYKNQKFIIKKELKDTSFNQMMQKYA